MDALVIALRLEGVSPVMGGLNQVGRQIQAIGSQSQQIAQRASSQARSMGPYSRQSLSRGQQPTLYDHMRDAQLAAIKADAAARRADRLLAGGPSFGDRVSSFARSTRFGGGGIMPLAGRTMDLFGLGKGAPIVLGALAGIVAIGAAAMAAAHSLTEISHARWAGGGSLADAVKARGLGAGLGMDAGGVTDLARALQNELATSPYAMGAGSRYGISDVLGNNPIGSKLNRFDNLFKLADVIRNAPSDQDAMRTARQFGAPGESLLPLRDLSPDVYKRMMESNAEMYSPDRVRAAADFNAELQMLKNNFMDLLITLTPLIRLMSGFVSWLNKWLTGKDKSNPFETPQQQQARAARSAADSHKRATEDNTGAIKGLQSTMQQAMFGGGERGRLAMPKNWSGAYADMNRQWDGEARKLGAFTV